MDPLTDEWVYRCPVSQVHPGCYSVVTAWWTHRGMGGMAPGPLPVAGGLLDQTYWFNRACGILDDEYAKNRKEIEDQRDKK